MDIQTKTVGISELKIHPQHEKIYGIETNNKLKERIKRFGFSEVFIVNEKLEVLSDNSSLIAIDELAEEEIKELQLDQVTVQVKQFDSIDHELLYFLQAHSGKEKTKIQKFNEGLLLEQLALKLGVEIVFSSYNTQNSEKGRTFSQLTFETLANERIEKKSADLIAEYVRLSSGRSYNDGRMVAIQINKYQSLGNTGKAEMLTLLFENTSSTAKYVVNYDLLESGKSFQDWRELKSVAVQRRDKKSSSLKEKKINKISVDVQMKVDDKLKKINALSSEIITLRGLDNGKTKQKRPKLFIDFRENKIAGYHF